MLNVWALLVFPGMCDNDLGSNCNRIFVNQGCFIRILAHELRRVVMFSNLPLIIYKLPIPINNYYFTPSLSSSSHHRSATLPLARMTRVRMQPRRTSWHVVFFIHTAGTLCSNDTHDTHRTLLPPFVRQAALPPPLRDPNAEHQLLYSACLGVVCTHASTNACRK